MPTFAVAMSYSKKWVKILQIHMQKICLYIYASVKLSKLDLSIMCGFAFTHEFSGPLVKFLQV